METDAFSAVGSNATATDDPQLQPLTFIDLIYLYCTLPIVLLGTVGNLLSVAVFRCTKLRRLSTSYYLTALSLSDTGFLLNLFVTWLDVVGVPAFNRPVLCQLSLYTSSVCSFLSPWLIVTFTVERFVATCYPLRCAMICTVARAKAIVAVLTFVATSFYSYSFVMSGVVPQQQRRQADVNDTIVTDGGATVTYACGMKESYEYSMTVLNAVDTVVTLVIPLTLIVGLNVQIARAIWWFEGIRRQMTTNDGCSVDSDADHGTVSTAAALNHGSGASVNGRRSPSCKRHHHNRGRYQVKITKMLLIISTVFLCLNAPSYLIRLWLFCRGESDDDGGAAAVIDSNVQQWCQLGYYLNFAINFLLYCVSGQNFRKALRSLFGRLIRKVHRRRLSRRNTGTLVTNSLPGTNSTLAANLMTNCPPCSASIKVACLAEPPTSVKDSV